MSSRAVSMTEAPWGGNELGPEYSRPPLGRRRMHSDGRGPVVTFATADATRAKARQQRALLLLPDVTHPSASAALRPCAPEPLSP